MKVRNFLKRQAEIGFFLSSVVVRSIFLSLVVGPSSY